MSSNTLVTRSTGQVILDSFFNDLRNAWVSDVMGRDVNGIPVSGNNLGTAAYPWGNVYANQMIVGGIALNTSSLERPNYQIVSGKTRSGSNQPAFLLPTVASPSFRLLASSVNLVLSVNGVSATWTADKNSIPVTTAPASNNTCLINDTTAAAQAATRTWGEYGSGAGTPYYAIAVDTMGSSISARVGSFQAFKVGTEYFLAFVDSTTSLSRAFRGFFFDSSGNPIKRVAFSDNATVTLMNLGWVFADSDGTTVDTIFVGAGVNNSPTYSYAAPTSPATGDYWFDEGNLVWKLWGGASWAVTNRILVGCVIADATNCVGARSLDFFGLCRSDNTVELEYVSNTVIRANGLFQRVNVNGRSISFGTTRATWDTASNLAASADRYNAAVTASIAEYFYVTDTGETKISDIDPYWRADLLGYYHPFNPWRCVGQNAPNGSAQFQSVNVVSFKALGPNSIPKQSLPAVGQQVSASSGAVQSVDATSFTDVSNLSVTITTSGRPVLCMLQPGGGVGNPFYYAANTNATPATGVEVFLALDRGGVNIAEWRLALTNNAASSTQLLIISSSLAYMDLPPPGTYTYKIRAKATSAGRLNITQGQLVCFEL